MMARRRASLPLSDPSLSIRASLQAAVLLAALMATGCTHGDPRFPQEPRMSQVAGTALPETRLTLPDGQDVDLRIEEWVFFREQNAIQVGYRLHNAGTGSIAVFDRGTYEAHAGAAYSPGAVADPIVVITGEDMELRHAVSAPDASDGPGRATPLALELKAGAEVNGFFVLARLGDVSPRRVRWCVSILPFEKQAFRTPHESPSGTIWVLETAAQADAVMRQMPLCTPWYDVATATFER